MIAFEIIAALAGFAFVGFCGFLIGRDKGHEEGIAIGWLQYRDEQIARDKARRDRIGRFRAKQKEANV